MRLRRAVDPVFVLIFVFGLVLSGCGGAGGGSTDRNPGPVATTTTLSASPTTNVTTATPVTLTATTVSSSGSGTPTGTVTFLDGGTSIGTANLASGVATLTIAAPAAGSHSFTASYGGGTGFSASASAAVSLTVASPPAATTTALVVAPLTNVTTSTPVTLTATVSSTGGTPAGTVTFTDGSTAVGTGTLSGGVATLTLSTLTAGAHSFTASYAGDSGFAASTSAAVALTVTSPPAATTTALVVAPTTNVTTATPVTLTATVSASGGSGGGTPTGSVTFLDGSTTVGTGNLTAGVATLALSTLTAGSHSFTASYAGDSDFAASTSTAVSLTVTNVSTINAHATFSFTTANQTISGFGAAEAFYVNWLNDHPNKTQIYKALFDPTDGLGLTYLRVQDLYRGNPTGFDPDTPAVVSGADAAHGSPLTLLMSSWSPPANLKSNGTTTGGGTLIQVSGAYDYAGFAQYWDDSLKAYAALGVSPDYISIQNEPDWPASYDSCLFGATEGPYASYGKAFDAVYNQINGDTSLTKIPEMVGPETLSSGSSFLSLAGSVPAAEISVYAHHLYNVSSTDPDPDDGLTALAGVESTYPTQTKFMTEYYDAPGFLAAWNIHNALTVADDNAYIFWGATWPSALDAAKDQAADQQGLIYIDNPFAASSTWAFAQGWTYNDAYYAMKHYSYYIRPGYVRYNATVDNTDERVSVYQSPDTNTTVIVALNVSKTATDVLALDLSSITYTTSAMYRSTFSQPISTGERWDNLGAYSATDGITLKPQSAVTVVLTK